MHMEFEVNGNTLIVRVKGELDLAVADRFREEMEEKLQQEKLKNLIVDLGEVSFIDSSCLGVILGRYKRLSEQGGTVAIIRAQPQVRRVLELSGIMRIMGIYRDEKGALKELM